MNYESMKIDQIEKTLEKANTNFEKNHKAFILGLNYLEKTGRFKENQQYKESSFSSYITGRFGMTHNDYIQWRKVYVRLSEEAEIFGAGNVKEAARKLKSVSRTKEVFAGLQSVKGYVRSIPVPPHVIKKAVQEKVEALAPQKSEEPTFGVEYWKTRALSAEAELATAQETIREQAGQIEKLKAAMTRRLFNELDLSMPEILSQQPLEAIA